jgi:K+-transporting ATPase ATPase C chain
MRKIIKTFRPAITCLFIMTIICGVVYPGVVTTVAQAAFPKQANGSTLTVKLKDGTTAVYGSALLAQEFSKPEYMIGRPNGTTNLSPTGSEQEKLVQQRIDWWHAFDQGNTSDIPMDLVTASGSGVDPNISPEAAEYQVARIAKKRGMSEEVVREIIKRYTSRRFLGFWGEPAVNVLKVNLALDGLL